MSVSTIKQFDLVGVGSYVQLGKAGNFLNSTAGSVSLNASDNSTLANLLVAEPTLASHAATKNYVDNAIQGLDVKSEVQAASAANIVATYNNGTAGVGATLTTASASLVVDGHTVANGDRILVMSQTDNTQNGIYTVSGVGTAVILTRATDADTGSELASAFVFVRNGTIYANTGWTQTTNPPITIGTSAIVWAQFSGAGSYTAGAGLTLTGGSFSVNTDGATTYVDGSNDIAVKSSATANQVLVSQGSGSAAWGALSLSNSNSVTGTLSIGNGGTNNNNFTANSIIITNGTGQTMTDTGTGSAYQVLVSGADGNGAPYFSNIHLDQSAAVGSSILGLANGGTNTALTAVAGAVTYSTGSALALTSAGTSGQILQSNGTSAPSFVNVSSVATTAVDNVGAGAGQIFRDITSGTINLRTLNAGSNKISINTDTSLSNTVSIDVVEANLTLDNIGGILSTGKGGTGQDFSTLAANNLIYTDATGVFAALPIDPYFQGLLTDSSAPAVQTSLSLVPGVNIQAYNASLAALSSLAGNGILVYTGSNTFAERAITVSGAGNLAGLAITNGDGVAAAPNLGLDINGLAAAGTLVDTNTLPMFDGTNNVKVTIAEIAAKVLADYPVDPLFAYGTISGYANGNIASMAALPTNARVLRVMVNVSAAYTAGANIQILDASGDILADVSDIDAQTIGIYMVELTGMDFTSAGNVKVAFTGTTATVGAATVSVDYRILA